MDNLVVPKFNHAELKSLRFPFKLWHIVNEASTPSIRWNLEGNAIVIDSVRFQSEILDRPHLFKTNCLSSVLRQLNLYGFRKTRFGSRINKCYEQDSDDDDRSGSVLTDDSAAIRYFEFRHPNFVRDQFELLPLVKRRHSALRLKNKENIQDWAEQLGSTWDYSECGPIVECKLRKVVKEEIQDFGDTPNPSFSSTLSDSDELSGESEAIYSDDDLDLPADWNYESYLKNFSAYEIRGPIPGLHYVPTADDRESGHSKAAPSKKARRGQRNSNGSAKRTSPIVYAVGSAVQPLGNTRMYNRAVTPSHTFGRSSVAGYFVPQDQLLMQAWPGTFIPVGSYNESDGPHYLPSVEEGGDDQCQACGETANEVPIDDEASALRQLAIFYNENPVTCPPGVDRPVVAESLGTYVTPTYCIGPKDIYNSTVDASDICIFGQ